MQQIPKAQKIDHFSENHGYKKNDPYHWLKTDNWREVMRDPSKLPNNIGNYLKSWNKYTEYALTDTKELQAGLFSEMKSRIKEDDSTVPMPDGPYEYFIDYIEGGQYLRYCRKTKDSQNEELILDGNLLAKEHKYFKISSVNQSPDHSMLAYACDINGSEYFTIYVKNIESGEIISKEINETTGSIVWGNDHKSIFYVKLDDNHRPSKVFKHIIGTEQKDDELIYSEEDPGFFVGISKTKSNKYIIIDCHDHQTSEVWIINANTSNTKAELFKERKMGHEYSLDHQGDNFIILTNIDNAEDFKIMQVPIESYKYSTWQEIISVKPGRLILSIYVFANYLVRLEIENGLPRIIIRHKNSNEKSISFTEEAYSLGIIDGYEYATDSLRFTYSSMTTPTQVFDYNMAEETKTLRKTQEIPSGHEATDYVTKRIFATAEDGNKIPISILYHKDTKTNGTAPLLLYGYGSYGISIPASFSTNRLSLVNRGFIYAIAHIRGGKEKGYGWYKDGKLANKTNTFTDFIAAAEYLITKEYTSKGRIIAQGGSAGGMLMGTITNMRPEIFNGVIAEVPFVDVLNTMLDSTLPLTPPEWPEWGNPIENKYDYDNIFSYSPYENVKAQDYPNILAVGGISDPRVTYWEPSKWIAKINELRTNNNLLLLKINMDSGHGGASGRFDYLHEVAFTYSFAIKISEQKIN